MFAIATWWNGIGHPSTPLGMASVTPSQPMTATSRSRTHGRQLASSPAKPSKGAPGPFDSLRGSRPVATSRMSPASTRTLWRDSAASSSAIVMFCIGSSHCASRTGGMSSSTPRLTMPSAPAMMLFRFAPSVRTSLLSKPLYIFPS